MTGSILALGPGCQATVMLCVTNCYRPILEQSSSDPVAANPKRKLLPNITPMKNALTTCLHATIAAAVLLAFAGCASPPSDPPDEPTFSEANISANWGKLRKGMTYRETIRMLAIDYDPEFEESMNETRVMMHKLSGGGAVPIDSSSGSTLVAGRYRLKFDLNGRLVHWEKL